MSSSSLRRPKDRGSGFGCGTGSTSAAVSGPKSTSALKASKTTTPVSNSEKVFHGKFSAGKENVRSTSRGPAMVRTQKPMMRPVARVDKASLVGADSDTETRVRKSATSAPRGRSSSPSDLTRVIADLRKERRVSVDRVEKFPTRSKVAKGGGNCRETEKIVGENVLKCKGVKGFENGDNKMTLRSGNVMKSSTDHVMSEFDGKGSSESGAKRVKDEYGVAEVEKEKFFAVLGSGAGKVDRGSGKKPTSVPCLEGSSRNDEVTEIPKEVYGDTGVGSLTGNKYQSRLHEKLAFLEGKVKRIASDIRKTKEMLDMNNHDASKVILSDIHDKISGIEKAISHVTATNSDANLGSLIEKSLVEPSVKVKPSVKGLSDEELEARLFPHQKLLRSRTSLKENSGDASDNKSDVGEPCSETKEEEKLLSPVDENSIASELLASLRKEKSKTSTGEDQGNLYCCEVQEADGASHKGVRDASIVSNDKCGVELLADEKLDQFDDQENRHGAFIGAELEDSSIYQMNEIGSKTSTGGWFVSEGEAVLLTHDDGSCSYYDIANCEEKALYMPPPGVPPNIWSDCWIIRAPGTDGCSEKFVVAASAGNTLDAGFCSWDFYSKDIRALQIENGTNVSRTVLGSLPNNIIQRRSSASHNPCLETRQWWYKPCGPLIGTTASSQKAVTLYDVRDSELIMKWDVQKLVLTMDYSCPLQWRNRGKLLVAEADSISLWDVSSQNQQALLSIPSSGRKISALHICNTDAELGGGVRQRVSSAEAEGHDGVFCTSDFINVLDFRHPSGVGMKISKLGVNAQSIFSRGDSIFLGCNSLRSVGKKQPVSMVQQFSLRKQGLFGTYALPESNAHSHHTEISQVWGNSNFVMGVWGLGLFVFDTLKDDVLQAFTSDDNKTQMVREVIGPDDLYLPSFDYVGSRALLISRDRPASWRLLS